jgi:hypothetical protein
VAPGGPTVDPAAAAAEIEDLEGGRHRLAALWRDRPVVLVFLRHFG